MPQRLFSCLLSPGFWLGAAVGSAAILAVVSGSLPETLRMHGLFFEIGILPKENLAGCQILPPRWRPSAKKRSLPEEAGQRDKESKERINVSGGGTKTPLARIVSITVVGSETLATRKPRLLFSFDGSLLLRFEEARLLSLLFQEPPRSPRDEPDIFMRDAAPDFWHSTPPPASAKCPHGPMAVAGPPGAYAIPHPSAENVRDSSGSSR